VTGTNQDDAAELSGKRAYQAPETHHALILHDFRDGRLVAPIGDLAAWLDNQPGNGTDTAESGTSSRTPQDGGGT
jgi:hypothetical protein